MKRICCDHVDSLSLLPLPACAQTATKQREVRTEQKSLWELFCPFTFRCSSLMLIPWRCRMKRNQVVLYMQRREKKVWYGREKELEKVKEDSKCFE